MEEFANNLKQAFLQLGFGIEIPRHFGKPLIHEKLKKLPKPEMKLVDITNFMVEMEKDARPQRSFNEMRAEMADIGYGIVKKTLKEGFGEVVQENVQISVQYTMFHENDRKVLDSTYIAEQPYIFVLGRQQGLLPGFERAVRTMRNQEKAEFIVPRILSTEDGKLLTEDERRSGYVVIEVVRVAEVMAEQKKASLLNNCGLALKYAEEHHKRGKEALAAGFNCIAADEFVEAVFVLRNVLTQSSSDNEKRMELLLRVYLYAGMAFNRMEQPKLAYDMLKPAVEMLENGFSAVGILKGKIYLHASRSQRLQGMLCKAHLHLADAKRLLGDTPAIKDEFQKLSQAFEHHLRTAISVAPLYEAFDEKCEDMSFCRRSHELMRTSFRQVMESFVSSKEKEMTLYGMQGHGNISVAEDVVDEHENVEIDVTIDPEDIVRFILTKK